MKAPLDAKSAFLHIAISLFLGVTLTFLSALYSKPILTDIIGFVGVTMRGYGFPFFWLRETKIVYVESKPEFTLLYDSFITDVLFWFSICFILIFIFRLIRFQKRA